MKQSNQTQRYNIVVPPWDYSPVAPHNHGRNSQVGSSMLAYVIFLSFFALYVHPTTFLLFMYMKFKFILIYSYYFQI